VIGVLFPYYDAVAFSVWSGDKNAEVGVSFRPIEIHVAGNEPADVQRLPNLRSDRPRFRGALDRQLIGV
jgi:hypothetical protein